MQIDHWMLFSTFAEQRHFEYPRTGTYKGVVINANMAAHAPAGLAAFLLGKTAGMEYIVDPLTHAFQHDPEVICDDTGKPRSSIKGLAEHYGEPIDALVGSRPVLPRHFIKDNVLRSFTERCVEFQLNHLRRFMAADDAAKYLEEDEVDVPPYAVVAPYFFLTETTYGNWLPICRGAAQYALEKVRRHNREVRVFGAVVVSQGILLDNAAQDEIAREFNAVELDGYLLWIDNLDEQTASRGELAGLLALVRRLRMDGRREVVNLHGGYFSILAAGVLAQNALSGVTHAPEFGEFRPVIPVGGGIPIARYYIPTLHARVRYRDALRVFQAKGWLEDAATFYSNICDCDACKDVLSGDIANFRLFGQSNVRSVRRAHNIVRIDFPTTEAKLRCLRHYLQRKHIEYVRAATASKDELQSDLREGKTSLEEVVGLEGVAHLDRWRLVLGSAD
ncbi:MAG TPA: hypothetical protein VMZ31_10505 [Phycisphaerae bacterium]|nr:hypothetical protein [Phycisphaerae bacterium]